MTGPLAFSQYLISVLFYLCYKVKIHRNNGFSASQTFGGRDLLDRLGVATV